MAEPSRYARVVVNVPQVMGNFDYLIPDPMNDFISTGSLVEVPFGNQLVQGIVIAILEQPEVEEVKPIAELVDPFPVLTHAQIELAKWLEHHSIASLNQCLQIMLLPGLKQYTDTKFTASNNSELVTTIPLQNRILALFQNKNTLRGRQIDKLLPGVDWRSQARKLVQRGFLKSESFLPRPGIHSRQIKKVQFSWPHPTVDFAVEPFASRSQTRRSVRIQLFEYLSTHPEPLDLQWVRAQVSEEITASDLEALSEAGMLAVWETELIRDPLENMNEEEYTRHNLTPEQQSAWEKISKLFSRILKPGNRFNLISNLWCHWFWQNRAVFACCRACTGPGQASDLAGTGNLPYASDRRKIDVSLPRNGRVGAQSFDARGRIRYLAPSPAGENKDYHRRQISHVHSGAANWVDYCG